MKPRLLLLLTLVLFTVAFMAFLVHRGAAGPGKMTCEKGGCTRQAVQPNGGGGGPEPESDNGSFHHLIVSTIK